MMKQQRTIKWMSLCFALLLVANLALKFTPNQMAQSEETVQGYTVTDISVVKVAAVSIKHENLSLGIIIDGMDFQFVTDSNNNFGVSEIRALVYALCNMSATQKFDDASQWQKFGIDTPSANISIINTDNETTSYQLLNRLSVDGSYYIYDPQQAAVFVIGGEIGDMILSDSKDLYNKSVFPAITGSNYQALESISLEYGDNGRDYSLQQNEGNFYLTSPITYKVPTIQVLTQLTSYISALYGDEVIAIDGDLSDYGFDDYDLKITMDVAGQQVVGLILIEDDDTILLANEALGDVFRVTQSNTAMIMQDYIGLLGGDVVQYAMGDVEKIMFTTDEQTATLVCGTDGTATVDGELLTTEDYQTLVTALNDLSLLAETAERAESTKSVLTMDVYYLNGTREKVVLTPSIQGGYATTVDGETHFTAVDTKVTALISLLDELR